MRDLNEVAVFTAVVAHGSFTAAARSLGVQKSTVSRMVSRLEERLGTRLLVRTSRTLAVTDAGRAYHERCAEALELLAAADGALPETDVAPAGTVRLTTTPDFGQAFVAPVVARLAREHPRLSVELVLTTRVVDLVEERVDLGIRAGPLPDSSLVARRLRPSRRLLVASPAYLARRRVRSVEDLASHEVLLYRAVDGRETWRLKTSSGLRPVKVSARLVADDFRVLLGWAMEGLGVALLPGFLCEDAVADGRLVPVLRTTLDETYPLFLVAPAGRHLPARVRYVHDALVAALGERSDAVAAG